MGLCLKGGGEEREGERGSEAQTLVAGEGVACSRLEVLGRAQARPSEQFPAPKLTDLYQERSVST